MTDLARWQLCVDRPQIFFAPEGGLEICGWCFNETSPQAAEVRLVFKGVAFECESGLARPDVGAVFPSHPAASISGFVFRGWVPSGYGSMTIQARTLDTDWQTLRVAPFFGETAPLVCRIDFPLSESIEEEEVTITGWACHSQEAIDELTLCQGGSIVQCHYGTSRPDVGRQFPNLPGSDRCGFYALLRPSASGPITLQARLVSGRIAASSSGKTLSLKSGHIEDEAQRLDLALASCTSIPRAEQPVVSIIIPVYNQIEVTLDCLRSIKRHTVGIPYEVILVDDNSSSHPQACLDRVGGLRLIRHDSNVGFLNSCNDGVGNAKGEYLIFLNNDTEPQRGWLSALLRVFQKRPDAGLVGAKLVYPDGRLQEAGGVIFNDASGWNYGRNDHPDKPEYNYVREADYCSGACIAIRRTVFEEVGRFDRRYVPAYYEDTDLAFKIREAGYKVYYQPQAVVIHHEGASSGTSTESGVKRFQLVNRGKFRDKWKDALSKQAIPDGNAVSVIKDRGTIKRVLVVDARVLCPDQDAGSVRMLNLLRIFQELEFKVTFAPLNSQRLHPYTEEMQQLGIECIYDPFMGSFEAFLLARRNEFDLILLSRAEVAERALPACVRVCPDVPRIFDTVDLHFLRGRREAEVANSSDKLKAAEEMRLIELGVASQCDAVLVVSPVEKELLDVELPGARIAILSTIYDVRQNVHPFEGRHDFVFIGGFEHPPNVDAMLWFCQDIMPKILRRLPAVKLHIIGSKMPDSVRSLASEHVITHGYVENVEPFFSSCRLSVAPLRFGAGVKGKINQSMSFGVPVVSTRVGAEGMHLTDGEDILVADSAAQFAEKVVELHETPQLWNRLSKNSLKNVDKHFSKAAARRHLEAVLADLRILGGPSEVQKNALIANAYCIRGELELEDRAAVNHFTKLH
jgi:GT2 family glycosyltransferase/glycosyltransferase involved in cell wall biosynthesis